jgi:hypothetical protein
MSTLHLDYTREQHCLTWDTGKNCQDTKMESLGEKQEIGNFQYKKEMVPCDIHHKGTPNWKAISWLDNTTWTVTLHVPANKMNSKWVTFQLHTVKMISIGSSAIPLSTVCHQLCSSDPSGSCKSQVPLAD